MARLNVNPTRMELARIKIKLNAARRGHKLLKDKRDELVRRFLNFAAEADKVRKECDDKIAAASKKLSISMAVLGKERVETAVLQTGGKMLLEMGEKSIMGVTIPTFKPKAVTRHNAAYGFAFTDSNLDEAVSGFFDVTGDLLRLTELEKAIFLMADELESVRRRVNALEYIMIPDFEETIRYIVMKLDEQERSGITRLMKVKDMVLEKG